MQETMERYGPLAGRVLLSAIFVMSGLHKIGAWDQTAAWMASKGMPMVPFFLVGAILLEVLGGLSVLLGFKARWGALALTVFLIPATLIFHNFWAMTGQEAQVQMIMFMKNLAILGGLAYVGTYGSGPMSLDAWWEKRKGTPVKVVHRAA